jgi:hypothetical protein
LSQAFELAGAVAGVAFLIYFIGGLVTWQRLRTLGLAEEASVAALPREGLLVAGLLALKSPLILGLFALLFYLGLGAIWRFERTGAVSRKHWSARQVTAFKAGPFALIGLMVVWVIAAGLYAGRHAAVLAAVAGALTIAAAWVSSHIGRAGLLAYGLFIAVVLMGGIVEYLDIKRVPTHVEPAAVFLDGAKDPVPGYFIAESSSFVYLATPWEGHPCQVTHLIRAFRRQDIAEIRLAPRINVWPQTHAPKGDDLEKCSDRQKEAEAVLANSP